MDRELLQKFFRNQCTTDEIKQVYIWFRTAEGKAFFENSLENDVHRYSDDENLILFPEVPSGKILSRIKKTRASRYSPRLRNTWGARIAVAAVICVSLLSGLLIYHTTIEKDDSANEIVYRTFSTGDEQHRIVSLTDGSQIRLNSNSTIHVPEIFSTNERHVYLDGEAWFQIVSNSEKPFTVYADAAIIHVLGTEFNVKIDPAANNIQIAVSEGMVAFRSESQNDFESIRATLSSNNFALYFPESDEIIIENTPVRNYMSWMDGKLFFFDEPLWQISRTLERLYNITIDFENDDLRHLNLSADLARGDITEVVSIISQTLGIETDQRESNKITWTSNKN